MQKLGKLCGAPVSSTRTSLVHSDVHAVWLLQRIFIQVLKSSLGFKSTVVLYRGTTAGSVYLSNKGWTCTFQFSRTAYPVVARRRCPQVMYCKSTSTSHAWCFNQVSSACTYSMSSHTAPGAPRCDPPCSSPLGWNGCSEPGWHTAARGELHPRCSHSLQMSETTFVLKRKSDLNVVFIH